MGVTIKWNLDAFEEIRRAPSVKADLAGRAARIAAAAGDGYESSSAEGASRSRASVVTTTYAAIRDNAKHNTLIRAVDAGRG
jgi:hypothetical protein